MLYCIDAIWGLNSSHQQGAESTESNASAPAPIAVKVPPPVAPKTSGPFAMRSHIASTPVEAAPVAAAAPPKWQPPVRSDSTDDKPASGTVAALKAGGPFGGNRVAAPAPAPAPAPEPERKPVFGVQNPTCGVCGKAVYAMEMLEADGKKYHKRSVSIWLY